MASYNYVVNDAVYEVIESFYANAFRVHHNTYSYELMEKNVKDTCHSIYKIENGLISRKPSTLGRWIKIMKDEEEKNENDKRNYRMAMSNNRCWYFLYYIEGNTIYVEDACYKSNMYEERLRILNIINERLNERMTYGKARKGIPLYVVMKSLNESKASTSRKTTRDFGRLSPFERYVRKHEKESGIKVSKFVNGGGTCFTVDNPEGGVMRFYSEYPFFYDMIVKGLEKYGRLRELWTFETGGEIYRQLRKCSDKSMIFAVMDKKNGRWKIAGNIPSIVFNYAARIPTPLLGDMDNPTPSAKEQKALAGEIRDDLNGIPTA